MSIPTYSRYKNTDVEWLGSVPDHWDVLPIKRLSVVRRGASPRPIDDPKYFDEAGEYAWVRIADVSSSSGYLLESSQQLSSLGSSLSVKIEPGELFVSIAGTVGKPCIAGIKACIHDGFVYFPELKIDPNLLFRIFEAGICYGGLGKMGTQLNLNTETIGAIKIALPPVDELKNILNFLDVELRKIDALVDEQIRLLRLLGEKRNALVSQAVTKGLAQSSPLKETGVDWIGKIPSHWDVKAIKQVVSTPITDGPHETPEFVESGVPFVSAEAVSSGRIDFSKIRGHITEAAHRGYSAKYKPQRNDIFMVKSGATTGVTAIVETDLDFNIWSPLAVVRCGSDMVPQYVLNYMRSKNFLEGVTLNWSFGTQQNIGMGVIANLAIPVPPKAEQIEIVAYIENQLGSHVALIADATRAIGLLRERRAVLISAAVTGKIDVCGLVAKQSDVAEEAIHG